MKKLLLCFFILGMGLQETQAQYHPLLGDTTKWCLMWNVIFVRSGDRMMEYNRLDARNDTTMGAQVYKKVWADQYDYFGALREDSLNKKVYFVYEGESVEQLLYDFNLGLGDTMVLDLHNNTNNNLHDGNYIVDSVNMVNIRGGLRKYIRLHNPLNTNTGPNGKPFKLEWIESVGEIHNPVYLYMYDDFGFGMATMSCGVEASSEVVNQEINGDRNYVDLCALSSSGGYYVHPDTCQIDYGGNVDELVGATARLTIFPNPSNGKNLTIEMDDFIFANSDLSVGITDLQGKKLVTVPARVSGNAIQLNDLTLDNGLYLVTLYSGPKPVGRGRVVVY